MLHGLDENQIETGPATYVGFSFLPSSDGAFYQFATVRSKPQIL